MNLCFFRLSPLGYNTHVLALIDVIQHNVIERNWRLIWVLGSGEAKLGVELVVYDKRTGLAGAWTLRKTCRDAGR